MSLASPTPGWYGKLPALGDFASRRLDPEWISQWDAWLATGLQGLREAAPETWLNHYLASPAWRFALLPGVLAPALDAEWRVGVLVPSVDRVGRYFPLVVVSQPLPRPADLQAALALWHWAGQLEDIAVTALQQDWGAEALDEALNELSEATVSAPLDPPPPEPWAQHLAAICRDAAWRSLQGHSLWCHSAAAPVLSAGLPTGTTFRHLFTPAGP